MFHPCFVDHVKHEFWWFKWPTLQLTCQPRLPESPFQRFVFDVDMQKRALQIHPEQWHNPYHCKTLKWVVSYACSALFQEQNQHLIGRWDPTGFCCRKTHPIFLPDTSDLWCRQLAKVEDPAQEVPQISLLPYQGSYFIVFQSIEGLWLNFVKLRMHRAITKGKILYEKANEVAKSQ